MKVVRKKYTSVGVSTVSIWLQVFELFAFLFRNGSDHTTCDRKIEGTDEVPNEVLQQYTDPNSEKYDQMIEEIRKELKFTSLQYNRLDDMLESVGIR